jgi:sugar phosphate isomerase/epimerase
MPGRGPLDFGPIMRTLTETSYNGFVSIFMHPYPRGIPILPSAGEVTAEINRARQYLESLAVG